MIAKVIFFSFLIYGAIKFFPTFHCYLPHSAAAIGNLATALKNDTLTIFYQQNIFLWTRKVISKLDQKIVDINLELEDNIVKPAA